MLLLFFAFSCTLSICDGSSPFRPPPKYVINLDKPPSERWIEPAKDLKGSLEKTLKLVLSVIPSFIEPLVEKIAAKLDDHFPTPFADEIRGVAKAANISLGQAVIPNIFYDVATFCTSIVARDRNGMIWHARNMDYGGFLTNLTQMLQETTILVDFQRGGKTVYSGVTFAGYVGLVTAQRPNTFTLTIDARDHGSWWRNMLVPILDRKVQPLSLVVRQIVETATSFKEAQYRLANTVTIAEVYYIMGGIGPEEGVVITKGRWTYDNIWQLEPSPGRWYLVETNFDHWKTPIDPRRQMAIKQVEKMGQNITTEALFNVISTPPVLNSITVYQIVMSAAKPNLLTVRVVVSK